MAKIRINVTDEQGVLLDSIEVDREEFLKAQESTQGAWFLLNDISIGKEA